MVEEGGEEMVMVEVKTPPEEWMSMEEDGRG